MDFKIVGVYHEYFELKQIRPRLLALRNFLKMKPYKGIELEEEDQSGEGYFSTEKLLEFVQASEEELGDALRDVQAFSVNGLLVSYQMMLYVYFCLLMM